MVLLVSVLPFSGRGVDLPRAVILISCTTAELKRRESCRRVPASSVVRTTCVSSSSSPCCSSCCLVLNRHRRRFHRKPASRGRHPSPSFRQHRSRCTRRPGHSALPPSPPTPPPRVPCDLCQYPTPSTFTFRGFSGLLRLYAKVIEVKRQAYSMTKLSSAYVTLAHYESRRSCTMFFYQLQYSARPKRCLNNTVYKFRYAGYSESQNLHCYTHALTVDSRRFLLLEINR